MIFTLPGRSFKFQIKKIQLSKHTWTETDILKQYHSGLC